MFYTYIHRRASDNQVFYVGKGYGKRAWSKVGRNQYWKNVVKKHGLNVEICSTWKVEQDAFEHERFLILCFKDLGIPLVNMTDGGEGFFGGKHSETTKTKMSISQKTRQSDENIKKKISEKSKESHAKTGVKEKLSVSLKMAFSSKEAKNRLSEAHKKSHSRPEVKEAIGCISRGTIWVNNGVVEKKIKKGTTIDDGYVVGRIGCVIGGTKFGKKRCRIKGKRYKIAFTILQNF